MHRLSVNDIRTLAQPHGSLHVSLLLPTARAGTDIPQAQLRLKNLVRQAEARLAASGWRTPDITALLAPAQHLQDDSFFWRHLDAGLAIFLAPSFQRVHRVPVSLEEQLVIGRRFHLKPLLPLLHPVGDFYLLALSQKSVRLFRGSLDTLEELGLEGLPHNLAEALRFDEFEKEVRFRTGAPVGAGRWSAIFYGSGGGDETYKHELSQFCHRVDQGLCAFLEAERPPLVLAGVDYLTALYRAASHYPNLVEGVIPGSPDRLSPEALHQEALHLLRPSLHRKQAEAQALYHQLAHTPRVTHDVRKVVSAAQQGTVQILFVALDRQVWGQVDPDAGGIQLLSGPAPDGEDLLNLAAAQTLLTGGAVFGVPAQDVPGEAPLAAVLRY